MRRAPGGVVTTLLLAAVLALVLQAGSVPHTHVGVGLYNHDHDLLLLAALNGAAVLDAAPVAPVVLLAVTAAPLLAAGRVDSAPRPAEASRAPPRA